MANDVPFKYIDGLSTEAQRQIERNFLEVQKNHTGVPVLLIVASNSVPYGAPSAMGQNLPDAILQCDGVTDTTAVANLLKAHPGAIMLFTDGNFIFNRTMKFSRASAVHGMGGVQASGTTFVFLDNLTDPSAYETNFSGGPILIGCGDEVDSTNALGTVDGLRMYDVEINWGGTSNRPSVFGAITKANGGIVAGAASLTRVEMSDVWAVFDSNVNDPNNDIIPVPFMTDCAMDFTLGGAVFSRVNVDGARITNFKSRSALGSTTFTNSFITNPFNLGYVDTSGNHIVDANTVITTVTTLSGGSLSGHLPAATFTGRDSSVDKINQDMLPTWVGAEPLGIQTIPAAGGSSPTGAAGGSLAGTYPNPTFSGRDLSVDAINKDMLPALLVEAFGIQTIPAATPSSAPTGAAGGSLSGTYPNPTFAGRDTSTDAINKDLLPSALLLDNGAFGITSFPAPAGGSLAGSYPNPTFSGRDSSVDKINQDMLPAALTEAPTGIQTYPAATSYPPSGTAGGSLAGTYPSPTLAGRDTSTDAINKDMLPSAVTEAPSGVQHIPPQLRRTGTGEIFDRAVQVLAGLAAGALTPTTDQIKANDAIVNRPNGAITAMSANGPGTTAAFEWGAAGSTDTKVYRKSAGNLELPGVLTSYDDLLPIVPFGIQTIPAAATGGGAPTGAAGGSLGGTYPNPTLAGRDTSTDAINKDMLPSALLPPMGVSLPARYPHLAGGTAGTGLLIPQIAWDAEGRLTNVNNISPIGGIDPTAWHNSDIGPMMSGDASGIQTYGGGTVGTTTQALLDFGAFPVFEKSFTVTDASVVVGMRILCSVAMDTGTGRQPDELEMDDLYATASVVSNGVLQVNVASDGRKGPVIGKFNLNYIVPVTVTQSIPSHASTHGRGASDPLDLLFKDMTQQFMMMG